MAAPAVVVFLCGSPAETGYAQRGATACIWLAVLTVPLTLTKAVAADYGIHFLPENLENSLVFAGAAGLISWVLMATLLQRRSWIQEAFLAAPGCCVVLGIAIVSPAMTAGLVALTALAVVFQAFVSRRSEAHGMWDVSMLYSGTRRRRPARPVDRLVGWWPPRLGPFIGISG